MPGGATTCALRQTYVVKKLALVGLFVVVAGCGGSKSVLEEGVSLGSMDAKKHVVGPVEARRAGRTTLANWKRELRKGARQRPTKRFQNLAPDELRARIARAADRYDFEVASLELLRPRQLAPQVIVSTRHYLRLARATAGILRVIDPHMRTGDDRTGWLFEGFYLRAEDEHGVPFLVAYNFWRGQSGGGGEWARSDRLFPFPHL
jgi:hypothetical protein